MWSLKCLGKGGFCWKLGLLITFLSSLFTGCAEKVPSPEITKLYEQYRQVLENATAPTTKADRDLEKKELKPLFKDISPLKKTVTVSFYQEHYENVFFFLAYESGLSLVLDPELKREITADRERITLTMKSKPLEEILQKVCEILDVHYVIEGGVLKILPMEEKILSLGFIPVVKEGRSTMGGDVLGSIGQTGQTWQTWQTGQTGGTGIVSSPIKGEFFISADLTRESLDIYRYLETEIVNLLSEKGKFSLNRLTGTLYVRDKPSRVRSVEKLVQKLRAKYKKQIILDAQIIEIELSKGHNLGVDWFEITNLLLGQNRIELSNLNLSVTTRIAQPSLALTISGQPNISLLLNLLREYGDLKVISNPKIRVLHSQPALISVGTSYGYVAKVTAKYNNSTGRMEYEPTPSAVFDGILLGITPFITEDDEVFLHIVPIKSDLIGLRDVKFENVVITLPTINLREMTSIVKARPNDLIVIGGLILDKVRGTEQKLDVPVLSKIFRNTTREEKKVELVILIRLLVS